MNDIIFRIHHRYENICRQVAAMQIPYRYVNNLHEYVLHNVADLDNIENICGDAFENFIEKFNEYDENIRPQHKFYELLIEGRVPIFFDDVSLNAVSKLRYVRMFFGSPHTEFYTGNPADKVILKNDFDRKSFSYVIIKSIIEFKH